MGLTKEYIAFLVFITAITVLLSILYIGSWTLLLSLPILVYLFLIGRKKIKQDWQYFSVFYNILRRNKYRNLLTNELFRK